jgi:simple sugar transport system ATP-binding protein
MRTAIEVRGIVKRFGPVLANDHINLAIDQGVVHAILGENGAGKSTLMNILYGLYQPDSGQIDVYGHPAQINSPRDAAALGIQMVHQHFMLGRPFTVAENLILGYEPTKAGIFLNRRRAENIVIALSERYGLKVSPRMRVESLSVGELQRVEILKALYRQANILILDEPTAVLTPLETEDLFQIMRRLKENQKTVIFITHKLREVLEIADRVTVLRHGRVVNTKDIGEVDQASLVKMMVGDFVLPPPTQVSSEVGAPVLQMSNVWVPDPSRNVDTLRGVTLEVRAGEILGMAGVEGNGQSELAGTIMGLQKPSRGTICLAGIETTFFSPRKIMELGIAYIPEDRQSKGIIPDFSISENLILGDHYRPPFGNGFKLHKKVIEKISDALIDAYNIRPTDQKMSAKSMSGGNQQKLIIARELRQKNVKLLVASQPTRGLDITSTSLVHQTIMKIRDEGGAVLLISADLDEIKSLSDRIAVMYRGEIAAIGSRADFSDMELGSLMLTGSRLGTIEREEGEA